MDLLFLGAPACMAIVSYIMKYVHVYVQYLGGVTWILELQE